MANPFGEFVRAVIFFIGAGVLAGLPGCLSFGGDGDSDTRTSKNAAETAIYREVAEMVKLYRVRLQKNEETPVKAKENCEMYKDACWIGFETRARAAGAGKRVLIGSFVNLEGGDHHGKSIHSVASGSSVHLAGGPLVLRSLSIRLSVEMIMVW